MAAATVDFFSLNAYQQQAYLNGDPDYMNAGPPQPSAQQSYQAQAQQLAYSSNFVTIPFGNSNETVMTLDSFLSQWAAGAVTEPGSLLGLDPVTEAAAIARDRCATIPTPDCANQAALAAQYGAQVKAAIANAPTVYAPAPAPAPAAPTPSAPPAVVVPATPAAPAETRPPAAPEPTLAPRTVGGASPSSTWQPHAEFISGGDIGGAAGGIATGVGLAASAAVSFGISLAIVGLASLFSGIFGGGNTDKLEKEIQQLKGATQDALDETTRFAWAIANGLGALWRAIAEIWDNFLDALWSAIKSLWKALWCVVSSVLPKIIQILKDLRKYLDLIYQKFIRPIMNYLQQVRKVLQILKLLHVPFAAKLDRILGQIQSAVFGPFLLLLRWFNTYGYWINTILAADLTLQKPIFLRTMTKYQGDWIRMWWSAQQGAAGAAAGLTQPAPGAAQSNAQELADFHQYAAAGTGPYGDNTAVARQILAAGAAGA